MKKFITMLTVALLVAVTSNAVEDGFFGSGTAGSVTDVVIPAASGSISAEQVLISVETNATVTIRLGSVDVIAGAASTGTAIVIATSSTNTVRGVTLTTSDYLIAGSQLMDIATLSPASANSTTVTVSSAAIIAKGQSISVADAGDNITVNATTTWANTPLPFLFKGRNNAPAAISAPTTAGATMISGKAVRE
jgi:hypothetical protein